MSGRLWAGVGGGLSFVRQASWGGEQVSGLGAYLGMPFGRGTLTVNANKRLDARGWGVAAIATLPLDSGVQW